MTATVIVEAGGLANRKCVVPASSDNHFRRSDWRDCECDDLPLPSQKTIKSVLSSHSFFLTFERRWFIPLVSSIGIAQMEYAGTLDTCSDLLAVYNF